MDRQNAGEGKNPFGRKRAAGKAAGARNGVLLSQEEFCSRLPHKCLMVEVKKIATKIKYCYDGSELNKIYMWFAFDYVYV